VKPALSSSSSALNYYYSFSQLLNVGVFGPFSFLEVFLFGRGKEVSRRERVSDSMERGVTFGFKLRWFPRFPLLSVIFLSAGFFDGGMWW